MKIFFYGNCQVGAISNYFNKNISNFDLLDGNDFYEKLTAIWDLRHNKEAQNQICKSVCEKVKSCDFFVFQHHNSNSFWIDELCTEYLSQITSGKAICIPNFRYSAYPNDFANLCQYVAFVMNHLGIFDCKEILYILKYEYAPWMKKIILSEHEKSMSELENRFKKEKESYPVRVNINSFIEKNWTNKLLGFKFMHPSQFYFEELTRLLLREIDECQIYPTSNFTEYQTGGIDVRQFNFFNNFFGDINVPKFNQEHTMEAGLQKINEESIRKVKDLLSNPN
jgi:hypothetical protein